MQKDPNKVKALEAAIAQIEKNYGQGSIMKLGDTRHMQVESVPTGSLSLDLALGVGGIPKGRIVEIYGPESSGKTTVALHMVAEVQKQGGIAGFIDAEHALDPIYAKNIGVNIDELYISQPDSGEQAMEITETMVRSGAVDIVIVDSVAALVPKQEIDGEMGDSHVGLQARLMSQALRKLTSVINKSNCTVIFINQLREKVGVMFGNPETTTGGRALKFYASVRLDVRRIETLSQGGEKVGNRVRVKVVKNKVAPPFQEAEFDIMFGKGISREGDLLDLAAKNDIIIKSGAWYSYHGEKIGQGRENAKKYLTEHPDVFAEVDTAVREKCLPNASEEEETAESAETSADTAEPDPTASLPDYVLHPDMEMPVMKIDGNYYIGVLTIPSLDLSLPVMEDWDDEKLKLSPCRYAGSLYQKNLVIAGHNYQRHFSGIRTLPIGSKIQFNDADGNEFQYTVVASDVMNPEEKDRMLEDGAWDLTLFTCNYGLGTRYAVRCQMVEENE